MAILTPSQLEAASNATYFDNTSGSITPTSVRTLNTDWISSSILATQTGSMTVASASVAGTASFALNFNPSATASYALQALNANNATLADQATFANTAGSANSANTAVTASNATTAVNATFATTASFALNFNPAATASYALFANTASFALNSVATFPYTGSARITGSLVMVGLSPIQVSHIKANDVQGVEILTNSNTTVATFGAGGGTGVTVVGQVNATTFSGSGVSISGIVSSSYAQTASFVLNAITASYASNADLLDGLNFTAFVLTSSFTPFSSSVSDRFVAAPTLAGNNTFVGNNIFGNVTASNALITSASVINLTVIYETASVIYSSGSNQFGDASNDTQTLYGTVDIKTGPLNVSGAAFVNNNVLQVTGPGVAPGVNYAGNTLTQLVGIEGAAFDIFLTNGGDSIHVETISGSGTVFQDINGQTFSNETWLTIPSNIVGNNPAPQFNRGLQVTSSLNVTGSIFVKGSGNSYASIAKNNFTLYGIDAPSTDVYNQIFSSDTSTAGQYIGAVKSDFSVDVEHAILVSTSSVTLNDWNNSTALYVPYLTIAPNTGNNPIPQFQRGLGITGSVNGNVVSASISSNTSSLNFSQGNFFTSLVGSNTFFNVTSPKAGQTVNLLLTTSGAATASFSSNVKQVSGSSYLPTAGTGKNDILTFISWDGTSVYLANVKNLI